MNIGRDSLQWNVFEILSDEWGGTQLLASFIMYIEGYANQTKSLKILYPKANALFFTNEFLMDLKNLDYTLDIIREKEGTIEHLYEKIERARAEKEAAEEGFRELDEKWSNKKIKTE
jgi:hypothetical protein